MVSVASTFSPPFLHSQRSLFNPLQIFSIPSITYLRYTPLSIGVWKPQTYVLGSSSSTQTPKSRKRKADHGDDDDNAIAELLVNECGLSPDEVSKVIRGCSSLSRARSIQTARKVVKLLKQYGFTATQLKHTIVRNPPVLFSKAHEQIKPRIEFLKTLGFTKQDLGLFISRAPRLLGMSLEKNLTTRIPELENLFGSKENLSKALRRSADILVADVEKNIKPKLEILQQSGVQDKLLFHLLSSHPFILIKNSAESLKLKIEYVKKMGIMEGSKTFTYALFVVTSNGPENLDKKLKLMERLGLSEDEIRRLIHKAPLVLNLSTDKLQKNMDFLTQTAGLPPSVVLKYPHLLSYSVENRFKRRYEFFKALGADQHDEQLPSLPSLLNVREQTFVNFVERSSETARIYEMCRRKSIT